MTIIGLTGKSGSGKDAAASHLVCRYGFVRLAFADALKAAAKCIFSLSDAQLWGSEKDVTDLYWGVTPGRILQLVGTECMRAGFADDVWIRALCRKLEGRDYVVTDVRFPNEAEAIRHWGGKVYRIERPGHVSTRAAHISETALDHYPVDGIIVNDADRGTLGARVAAVAIDADVIRKNKVW